MLLVSFRGYGKRPVAQNELISTCANKGFFFINFTCFSKVLNRVLQYFSHFLRPSPPLSLSLRLCSFIMTRHVKQTSPFIQFVRQPYGTFWCPLDAIYKTYISIVALTKIQLILILCYCLFLLYELFFSYDNEKCLCLIFCSLQHLSVPLVYLDQPSPCPASSIK